MDWLKNISYSIISTVILIFEIAVYVIYSQHKIATLQRENSDLQTSTQALQEQNKNLQELNEKIFYKNVVQKRKIKEKNATIKITENYENLKQMSEIINCEFANINNFKKCF